LSTTEALPPPPNALWEEPPDALILLSEEVHVWRAALDRPERVRERLAEKLSRDERARAKRIRPARDRERWTVARALLRVVLGRYLGVSPAEVGLGGDPGGKPVLAAGSDQAPVSFNLSHSGDVALYAVTGARRVGVDVERVRDDVDAERIAARLFPPAERAALQELPEPDRREAFFSGWTRREACAKAVGKGVAALLAGSGVSLPAGEHAELGRASGDGPPGGPWTVWDLAPKPGYAAAVAVEGSGLRLRCLDLTKGERILLRGRFPRPAGY
jgi:4'-phosphopantetheinyl transferase